MSEGVGGAPSGSEKALASTDPVARFEALLVREREAAAAADVEQLVALQAAKRAALDALQRAGLPQATLIALGEKARMNVVLIRQLVQCLGGLVGSQQDGTYDAYGNRGVSQAPSLRGAL